MDKLIEKFIIKHMLKILQINNFSERIGGAEVVFLNSIDMLKQKGHSVFSFSTRIKENMGGSDYSIVHSKSIRSRFYSREANNIIKEIILKEKPNVAHIHNIIGGITYSILPELRKNNIPIVATIHDYKLLCPACNFVDSRNMICEKCKGGKYYNCTINNCSTNGIISSFFLSGESYLRDRYLPFWKMIDQFIFVSNYEKNKFLEVHPQIGTKANIIYNFTNKFLQEKKKGSYFISFGRLAVEKGLLTLLDAFRERPNLNLKIVGDGPLKNYLEKRKTSSVELLGYKTGVELEDIIRKASFTVVPSESYETNSLTTVESYSMGKPVIGSRIGALEELIKEGVTGFTFKPKDHNALSKLSTSCSELSDNEYQKYSDNAFKFANDKFSPDVHYEQLIKVYEKVVNQ
ncbi:MAG: glycosyltransferase family 4 protein [Melioribacteraceae bacterium]|nr:glycosyltransferase family 4 protein [Melioribacteraceae bacterium]